MMQTLKSIDDMTIIVLDGGLRGQSGGISESETTIIIEEAVSQAADDAIAFAVAL